MCCVCVVVVVEQITGGGLPPHTTRLPHHHWHQCHSYGAGDGYNSHDLEHTFPHLKHAGFHAKTFAPQRGQPHCVALSVNGIPKARKSGRQRPPTATSGTRIPMVALRDFIRVCKNTYRPVHNSLYRLEVTPKPRQVWIPPRNPSKNAKSKCGKII